MARSRVTGATPAQIKAALDRAADEAREALTAVQQQTADRLKSTFPAEARATLPRRGGFAALVAAADLTITGGGSAGPTPTLVVEGSSSRVDLAPVNAGQLRHPTYGGAPWVSQKVRPGVWDRSCEKATDPADADLAAAAGDIGTRLSST